VAVAVMASKSSGHAVRDVDRKHHGTNQASVFEEYINLCARMDYAPTEQLKVLQWLSALRWIKKQRIIDDDLSDAEKARELYILALQITGRFINACGYDDVGEWIDGFALEFNDFHNGAGSKLFGQKEGKADSSRLWVPRAFMARGIHIRIKNGLSRNEIIEELNERSFSKKFPSLKALVRQDARTHKKRTDNEKRPVTLGKSALWWRDELQKGRCKNIYARGIWASLRDSTPDGLDPVEHANDLFREANAQAAKLIAMASL
jgi:hypothetical protein